MSGPRRRVSVADLGLRVHPKHGGQHGIVLGGNGSGKSTLAEHIIWDFLRTYKSRAGRVMIVDSKPRFRTDELPDGRNAKRLYRSWGHGVTMPKSVRVTSTGDIDLALKMGGRLLIAQQADLNADPDLPRLAELTSYLFGRLDGKTPTLCYWDEVLDFYGPTGMAAKGCEDTPRRWARAARERHGCALFASQRTRGLPKPLVTEITKAYVHRMDFAEDVAVMCEAGAPKSILDTPQNDHAFTFWTKQDRPRVYGPYTLDLEARQ